MLVNFMTVTDEQLLVASVTDPEAFAAFYDRHAVRLIGALCHRAPSHDVALDLAAEVFACALERCSEFTPQHDGSASAWLYAIARNKLADVYRSGAVEDRARRRLGMEPLVLSDKGVEQLERRIDAERAGVLEALADLPTHEREAISARVVNEQDYPEIAARLRVSESVVRQRVSRGLRRLRSAIKEAT